MDLAAAAKYLRFEGVYLGSSANTIYNAGTYNTFGPITAVNNAGNPLTEIGGNTHYNSILSVNNTTYGFTTASPAASNSTFLNAAIGHTGAYGFTSGTGPILLRGNLLVATTGITWKCYSNPATGLGFNGNSTPIVYPCTDLGVAGSHTTAGEISDAVLRLPSSILSSFVGKVTTGDTANASDSSGTAAYSTTLDFFNFDNAFRSWGKSHADAFGTTNHRGRCSSGTCQIWDYSLQRNDTTLLNASTSVKSTCSSGPCPLANEVYGDGIGDNDGVCETGDVCFNKFNGDDNLNGLCDSNELCDRDEISDSIGDDDGTCESGELCKNTFAAGTACPVEVRGSEYVDGGVYAYDASYTSGLNGYQVEEVAGVDGDNDGVCEPRETCQNAGNGVCESGERCMQRFLKTAVEIAGDSIGDDDSLCEANEECMYAPNYGLYQGHGTVLGSCTSSANGGLTGIAIYGYEFNGK
jgi:hypothetical protein